MNLTEVVKRLKAVAFALDKLEVKGRENLDILLGSIQTIERSANIIEQCLQEMEPKEEEKLEE